MSTSRKRNPIAIAGRLTAVTLSVALLAGCTGARFMMGGDPAPVNPAGAPAVSNQPSALVNVSGKATLAGVPLANATVKVFDALTNAPAAVISAGGGNVIAAGGANFVVLQTGGRPALQVAGQSFTTDAQGNFSLPLGNFKPGMAARIVVTAGGKTVTTLVSGSGKALQSQKAAYQVTQFGNSAPTGGWNVVPANEFTHVATQLIWGATRLTGTLNLSSAVNIIDNTLASVNEIIIPSLLRNMDASTANQLTNSDPLGRVTDLQSLTALTKSTGLDTQVNNVIDTNRQSVAQQAQNRENVVQTVTLTNDDFAGSNMNVTLTNGQLTFTNTTTGETSTITLPAPPPSDTNTGGTETPGTQEPQQQEETSAGPNETQVDISNTGAFNPTVTVSGNLTVTVQQPSGTDDIAAIYARIPTAGTTLTAANIASNTSGNITAGPQAAALTVAVDPSPDADGNLPPRFASAALSGRVFAGHLMRGTQKVATFRVYTMGSFHYLVTKYLLTDSVKTNGGHTTSVTTTAITGVATGTKAEITLVSRNGNFANIEKNTQ
jgi:hypothetical protein